MFSTRRLMLAMVMGGALIAVGCGPTYPKCDNDDHCADKGEYCLNAKCQECRESSHCKGPGMMCSAGNCQRKPGYCDPSVACPGNQKCRDNQCGPECLGDGECGGADKFCDRGSCASRPECGANAVTPDCADGQECVSGACETKINQCSIDPVLFDFDRHNIKSNQTAKLKDLAACLKGDNTANLSIEGHCDERGTEEYNMSLGERRAAAALRYLKALGVPAGKLSSISYGDQRPASSGSNEGAWRQNRRAAFESR
jgi:peptidoglycan-associated lipoprotein